jgi:hypothetical protein
MMGSQINVFWLVNDELSPFLFISHDPVFSGFCVTQSLVLYVCFVDRCLSFCTFSLAIMLSVLLRYTDYDCPSGIFKLFFNRNYKQRFLITLLIPSYIIFVRVVFLMHYFCKSCLSYAFLRKQRLFGQIEKSKYN